MTEEMGHAPSPSGLAGEADKPRRVQLRRTKGWQMPPNTVRVCRPTVFGKPFTIEEMGRHDAVEAFRSYVTGPLWEDPYVRFDQERLHARIKGLRGKNLACWCALGKACHADVLLELANAPEHPDERQATTEGRRANTESNHGGRG